MWYPYMNYGVLNARPTYSDVHSLNTPSSPTISFTNQTPKSDGVKVAAGITIGGIVLATLVTLLTHNSKAASKIVAESGSAIKPAKKGWLEWLADRREFKLEKMRLRNEQRQITENAKTDRFNLKEKWKAITSGRKVKGKEKIAAEKATVKIRTEQIRADGQKTVAEQKRLAAEYQANKAAEAVQKSAEIQAKATIDAANIRANQAKDVAATRANAACEVAKTNERIAQTGLETAAKNKEAAQITADATAQSDAEKLKRISLLSQAQARKNNANCATAEMVAITERIKAVKSAEAANHAATVDANTKIEIARIQAEAKANKVGWWDRLCTSFDKFFLGRKEIKMAKIHSQIPPQSSNTKGLTYDELIETV